MLISKKIMKLARPGGDAGPYHYSVPVELGS